MKPLDSISNVRRGFAWPAIKCRDPEYLPIIYGPEYLLPGNPLGLRAVGYKRSLANRNFALGIEALECLCVRSRCGERMNAFLEPWRSKANL